MKNIMFLGMALTALLFFTINANAQVNLNFESCSQHPGASCPGWTINAAPGSNSYFLNSWQSGTTRVTVRNSTAVPANEGEYSIGTDTNFIGNVTSDTFTIPTLTGKLNLTGLVAGGSGEDVALCYADINPGQNCCRPGDAHYVCEIGRTNDGGSYQYRYADCGTAPSGQNVYVCVRDGGSGTWASIAADNITLKDNQDDLQIRSENAITVTSNPYNLDGFIGNFSIEADPYFAGNDERQYAQVWFRGPDETEYTCDALGNTETWQSNYTNVTSDTTLLYSLDTEYEFKLLYFDDGLLNLGFVDVLACTGDASAYYQGESLTANASTYECYDIGQTPYSEDCETVQGSQDYVCNANSVCIDATATACGGKGHDADCVGTVIDGTTCDMTTCWCDWLTWQEPICNLKAAAGEDCYVGYGCESGFCQYGEDTGISCECGTEGCENPSYDCLYGSSAGPATDHCWIEGTCAAEGGADTGMYLGYTDLLSSDNKIELNWTASVEDPFGFYVVQIWTDYPESTSEYLKDGCEEDDSIIAITDKTENYSALAPPCHKGGSNTYRVLEWDAAFNTINYSNTVTIDVPECYDNNDCNWAEYCNSEGRCTLSGECEVDDDCTNSDSFCYNPYWSAETDVYMNIPNAKSCSYYLYPPGASCDRDGRCESGTCTGVEDLGACTYSDYGSSHCGSNDEGICMSDDVCRKFGVCTDSGNTCTTNGDCETLYGNYDYYCDTDVGQCFQDSLEGGSCEDGGDNQCMGYENSELHCIADQCVQWEWECNYRLEGCTGDTYCNGDPDDTPNDGIEDLTHDHTCIVCDDIGDACTWSGECCAAAQCMADICVPLDWECMANNPNQNNVVGNTGPPWERYCGSDASTYNYQWCYSDPLTNGLAPGGVGDPDNHCYSRYEGGLACDYDYQCQSLECDTGSYTCTGDQPCDPEVDPECKEEVGDAKVEAFLGSINNPTATMRVGEEQVLKARYTDPEGEYYKGSAVTCKWAGSGFLAPQGYELAPGASYYQKTIKAKDAGVHRLTITCYTGDSCQNSGDNVCVSDYVDVTIQAETWSYIDCGSKCAACYCPTRTSAPYEAGGTMEISVLHRKGNDVVLRNSDCTVTIDYDIQEAATEYDLERKEGQSYYENNEIEVPNLATSNSEDVHAYKIECDDGTHEATYTNYFTVEGDTCNNGEWDDNEDGVDCGGPCPDECDDDCFNDEKDNDETDVDCGGRDCRPCENYEDCLTDRDCESGFCMGYNDDRCTSDFDRYIYECRQPRCNDDCLNGDENQIDCGGDCDTCPCADNTDCDDDGSEHCEFNGDIFGECEVDTCVNDEDCQPLMWGDSYRQRFCDTDLTPAVCQFGSNNGHDPDAPEMRVVPISGTSYVNSSGTLINVHVCEEDSERGYRVSTNFDTTKHYVINEVDLTPSIPAKNSEYYTFGSREDVYEKVTTDLMDDLCNIPSTQDMAWHSTTIFSSPKSTVGSSWMSEVVYGVSFREPFEVEVSRYTGNTEQKVFEFNLTRPGLCNYSQYAWEDKTEINAVASDFILFNYDETPDAKSLPVFRYKCVSSYGEVVEGTYTYDPLDFLEFQTWMIYLIVFIFAIPVPLIVLLILRWNTGGPRNDGT